MHTAPDRGTLTLFQTIQESIWLDITIMSDLWAAYGGIQTMRYTHQIANRTYEFVYLVTGALTQDMKNLWKNDKFRNKRVTWDTSHHA